MYLHCHVKLHKGEYRWLDVYYYWMRYHYFSQSMYCKNHGKASWIYFTRCANSLSWEVARKSSNDFLDFICCTCSCFLSFSLLYVIHIWILPRTPMFLIMILLSIPMLMLACKGALIISRYAVFTVFSHCGCLFYCLFRLKMGIGFIFFLFLKKAGYQF